MLTDGSITPGRVLATALAIAGAIGFAKLLGWFWCDVLRPLLDSYIVRAVRRQRAEFETYLRGELFADDIEAARVRETMTLEAVRLSQACERSLVEILRTQAEQARAIEAIPRLADATERLGGTLDRLDTTLGDMRVEMGRQAGTLEQMQRNQSWDGATERRHDSGRRDSDKDRG